MTPSTHPLPEGEVHVWTTRLDEVDASAGGRTVLDAEERARADGMARPELTRRFTAGRAWTRRVLARYTGLHPADVRFAVNEFGKPSLDPDVGVCFNASHSGDLAVVAVARLDVGVDIERVRELANFQGMADRVLSAPERTVLDVLGEPEQAEAFFDFWTRKEAFLKGVGTGIRSRLARLTTRPGAGELERVAWEEPTDDPEAWRVCGLTVPEGYRGAVACRAAEWVVVSHPTAEEASRSGP